MTVTEPAGSRRAAGLGSEERRVIFASSLGTVFEWYDFYLYATLAPFFAALFFPPGNDTAALLSAFATYAAGFLVRPFGAILFGRIGDLAGRKYTFLITIIVMGTATFAVGLLPTFATIGWMAPVLLVALRLLQGLALGGEYGGAATYVAEHARPGRRGFATSWIQTTATLGFFLALLVIGVCRFSLFEPEAFADWGWRVPFLVSLILLVVSVYIRLKLNESPVFLKMREEGRGSKSPIKDSFFRYPNNKYVLLALLGRDRGPGRRLVHRPVLRPVLPDDHAEGRAADGLSARRRVAADRHAVLPVLRLAERQDRPLAHHPGRMPARGPDLLPAVRGLDPLRQSRPGGLSEREPDRSHGRCSELQSACLRRAVVEVQRLRSRQGFPDEVGAVIRDRRCARHCQSQRGDRREQDRRMGREGLGSSAQGRRLSRKSRSREDRLRRWPWRS